jgi:hypothetical protein
MKKSRAKAPVLYGPETPGYARLNAMLEPQTAATAVKSGRGKSGVKSKGVVSQSKPPSQGDDNRTK